MVVVIGGLIREEKVKVLKKVPFFGDVPFLGKAFHRHGRSVKRTETVIFLNLKASLEDSKESKTHGN